MLAGIVTGRRAWHLLLVLVWARRCELIHHIANGEARCLGAWREVLEAFNILCHDRLSGHEEKDSMREPIGVELTRRPALERIGAQIV